MAELKLKLSVERRWWFRIAWTATIVLIYFGLIRDTEKAAGWLARRGMKYRAGNG